MIKPMLCAETKMFPPLRDKYLIQSKEDGVRAVLIFKDNKLIIQNREGKDILSRYPEFKQDYYVMGDTILDGELVSHEGFTTILSREQQKDKRKIKMLSELHPVHFHAFDLLRLDGQDLFDLKYSERYSLLQEVSLRFNPKQMSIIRNWEGDWEKFWEYIVQNDLEGVVFKLKDGTYQQGERSAYCLKMKNTKNKTKVVTAYTRNNKGIRATDGQDFAVQIFGIDGDNVATIIDKIGSCTILIKYLNSGGYSGDRQGVFDGII